MNIDTLLDEADPGRALTLHEQAELDRLVDSVGNSRRRPRARAITGIAALSALLLAGGATAAAAAGIWHPSWYDPASDWTTNVKTVDRTFTVDGQQHHCTVTLTLASTYSGKGTPEFQKALSYVRSLDPTKIQPSASQIHDFLDPTWVGQGAAPTPPSKAMANQLVWLMDVSQNLFDHLNAIGLDPAKVSFSRLVSGLRLRSMTRIGDDELRSLQKEHGPSLLAYFARRIEPPEDAAVLLNELLEVVWRRASAAPAEPEELRMWMFGIARNLVLSQHRGWRRRAALAERLREELASQVPAIQDECSFMVRRAVRALPETQRELVRLVHWDGFTITEAAQLTGVSPSTARSRYQLARRRLARELGGLIDEQDPALELTR